METLLENSIPGLSDSIAKIREDVKSGVENLTEECVSTMADVTRLLMKVFIFLVLICAPKGHPYPWKYGGKFPFWNSSSVFLVGV
ncbi:uncharacterized protein E6C27_scaffold19820G00010 [Cucumis melo var. makuwa]|uniref:Uncharacterized protein n=1 Tax=Cucumis melo var. makuwa TaxID=1194695 RepID=A0A5A7T6V7_CUCMM|nr:uncharacterized protein E6C27_scaffold19820G00010 [Cucumis melo var. makuwa]